MKKLFFFIVIVFTYLNCHAQFGEQQIISTDIAGARSVFTSDIDGDGDLDVLSASRFDDKVSWFENTDGLGDFGEEQTIDTNLPFSSWVFAIDLDGDDDNDVLSLSDFDNKLVWYKNLDGLGDFSTRLTISTQVNGAISVFAIDLDGDGDNDVISSSANDNKIAWYRNDGLGNFGAQLIISTNALAARQVTANDIDGDGDIDIIYAAAAADKIIWHENTNGLGDFGNERIISTNVNGVISVFSQDIDGDDDMDIISTSFGGDEIAWHENIDGLGNFSPKQIISLNVDAPRFVYAVDLDNDNDIDVLSASHADDKIAWYENTDGVGTFGSQQIISSFPDIDAGTSVIASDIDNDGDMDVLSASLIDAKIAWYENLTILGVRDNVLEKISFHPNPTKDYLYIDSKNIIILEIEIFDALGRYILTEKENFNQLNLSKLKNGILFLKIKTESGIFTTKVIKE